VGYRDDLHLGSLDAVDQREWKPSQAKSPMFRIESRSQSLMLSQARAGLLDFNKKLLPETRYTVFVIDRRCPQFSVRGTVKFHLHRRFS
jgi:hypothetical protein